MPTNTYQIRHMLQPCWSSEVRKRVVRRFVVFLTIRNMSRVESVLKRTSPPNSILRHGSARFGDLPLGGMTPKTAARRRLDQ